MTTKLVTTSAKGVFQREPSKFRNWIERSSKAAFPAEKDRYHLYVSLACPWASRCLGTLYLKGLNNIIGLSVVHPVFQRTRPGDKEDTHAGWAFVDPAVTPTLSGPTYLGQYPSKGSVLDTVNNARFIRDLYELSSDEETRYSVPQILAEHRFLVGDRFTEADLRLFTTLIRFDEVYAVHFKANKKLIAQYPNLSNYVRDIYQLPPITKTVDMQHIKMHYYASHTHLNPFGFLPVGPGVDFTRAHDRGRFTNAILPSF
ncbi:hypothetical protein BBJ28_00025957 [Nothophytophthora sp. Chile5]|nr:hypothetical protein BBJ28_00025957 [Nothophytophthora sp. Chile5]